MDYAVLAALVGFPIILLVVFRANSAVAFLGLCGSMLINQYTIINLTDKLNLSNSKLITTKIAEILIIGLPLLITVFLTRKRVSTAKIILYIIPIVCTGLAFAYLLAFYLPNSGSFTIKSNNAVFQIINNNWHYIIAAGVVGSLLPFWALGPKSEEKHHRKHK